MKIFFSAILSFVIPVVLFADFMAHDLFEAALYEDAAALLEKQSDRDAKDTFTLAKCYFALDRFEDVIALLQKEGSQQEEKHLLALAYQRIHEHDKAIAILSLFAKDETISYDLALSYFVLKDYVQAETLFQELALQSQNNALQKRANVYLVKIDFERGLYDQAEKKLQSLLLEDKENPHFRFLEGDLYFRKKQYEKAICCFEALLPKRNKSFASWYTETLYQLGWSYLKLAEGKNSESDFNKAELAFQELTQQFKDEKAFLSLAEVLLSKGKHLEDSEAYSKANHILADDKNFTSVDGKNKALLMQAEASPQYEEREKRYAEMIVKGVKLADSWYFRGINELNEGLLLNSRMQKLTARKHCKCAAECLTKAYELYQFEPLKAALALKSLAIAHLSQEDKQEGVRYLELCIREGLVAKLDDPLEIYYLKGLAESEINRNVPEACAQLQSGIARYKKGACLDKAVLLLGQMYHQCQDFESAETTFLQIPHDFPSSLLCAQAYYGASLSAQAAGKTDAQVKHYKQAAYEKYPDSAIAAECYFNYYAYNEYLQGDRKALKHLQALPIKFPKSVFSLNAHYLLGLDLKRDRKSAQGKWISKKNYTQAVEAFANVESCFDLLFKEGLIPFAKLDYYIYLRYRAILERALANSAIADDAKGAKRQIYLEYAGEVFKKILTEFQTEGHPLAQKTKEKELFPKIVEESYYNLAKIYWQTDNADLGEQMYREATLQYQTCHITKSYFLAKLFTERGLFAFSQKDFQGALLLFKKASEAGNSNILNSDETLELLIQQSLCLQEMEQLEEAMLLLSQVINCDVVSSLRLKAMFLRANIYERLGKPQLAKRQLETIVAKGGDWAKQAEERLEKDYGFY